MAIVMTIAVIKPLIAQQQSITITGSKLHDAVVYRDTRPGQGHLADTNYGNYTRLSATAWTHSGSNTFWRTLLYFDLSDIPAKSTIHSATLYLYSNPSITSPNAADGNSQLSGSNAFYIERITEPWDEMMVTWNNQPATTTSGRVYIGPSTSPTENRQISLTNMVRDWVNSPISNNGVKMTLENELRYRSRNYVSTNHSNSSLHPRLVVSYTPVLSLDISCETVGRTPEESKQLPWYGNETFLNNFYDSLMQAQGTTALRVAGDVEIPLLRVPVQFWVYQISNTNPGGNPDVFPNEISFQLMLDDANNAFRANSINLRFYIEGVNFISDPGALLLRGDAHARQLSEDYWVPGAVNVHVVDDGIDGGRYYGWENVIFLNRTVGVNVAAANTFTHEMGHFFGLDHTHQHAELQRALQLRLHDLRFSISLRQCHFRRI